MDVTPFLFLNKNDESKIIKLKFKEKIYPLEIILSQNNIKLNIQEKYDLFPYQTIISYQDFLNIHKYFRLFDTINEIYNDLIKGNIIIKEIDESNKNNLNYFYIKSILIILIVTLILL